MNALGAYLFEPVSASGLAKVAAGCVGALAQSQATAGLGIYPLEETAQQRAARQARDRWQIMAVSGIGLTVLLALGARFGAGWYVGKQFGRPGWGTVAGGFFGAPGMGLLALFPEED